LVEELARVTAERDEARAEVETRKEALLDAVEQIEGMRTLRDTWYDRAKKYEKERDEARAEAERYKKALEAEVQKCSRGPWVMQAHPEPSRLEIATILKAGWWSNPEADYKNEDDSWWIEQADKLIKANRQ